MRFDREPCPQAVSYSSCPTRTLPRWCLIKWKTKTIFTKSTGFHISWSAPTGYPTVKVHASRLCPSSTWCSGFAPLHRRSNLVLFTSAQINYIQHTGFSRYKNKTVHIQICQLWTISRKMIRSTVLGNVFRRDTACPWSMLTKLYPFACKVDVNWC